MGRARVLIADGHEVVRQGVRTFVERHANLEVVGEAADGREAVKKAVDLKPDVIVMDITMPELSGLEAMRLIHKSVPEAQILALTIHDSEQLMGQALAAGARGYMTKSDAGQEIAAAVLALSQHQPYFSKRYGNLLLERFADVTSRENKEEQNTSPLTGRESEIIQLLAKGKSSKEVATILGITVNTAETHRTNLMRKLHLHSISELIHYAIRNNIVAP
jgi:DNA-binding NarL/FixJ family response regulator